MKKITLDMVHYWLGSDQDEGAKTIREIANSKCDDNPWTPDILYNDIIGAWEERPTYSRHNNSCECLSRLRFVCRCEGS